MGTMAVIKLRFGTIRVVARQALPCQPRRLRPTLCRAYFHSKSKWMKLPYELAQVLENVQTCDNPRPYIDNADGPNSCKF